MRRRCPRCGRGRLFQGWYRLEERCSECELVFEPKPGDTWGFWVFGDRIFLFVAMVGLFFGIRPEGWAARIVFILAIAVPLIWTMPNRQGAAVALDYLLRRGPDSE